MTLLLMAEITLTIRHNMPVLKKVSSIIVTVFTAIGLAPPAPETPARLVQIQPQAREVKSAQIVETPQYERPPDFGEYVDFGAHTGDNGAFGWYADYPINNQEDSSYRK